MQEFRSLCAESKFEEAYKNVSSQVVPLLKQNKTTVCIVASDPDNVPCVILADYLVQQTKSTSKITKAKALDIIKDRRP